jgi:hypothetical protein
MTGSHSYQGVVQSGTESNSIKKVFQLTESFSTSQGVTLKSIESFNRTGGSAMQLQGVIRTSGLSTSETGMKREHLHHR